MTEKQEKLQLYENNWARRIAGVKIIDKRRMESLFPGTHFVILIHIHTQSDLCVLKVVGWPWIGRGQRTVS